MNSLRQFVNQIAACRLSYIGDTESPERPVTNKKDLLIKTRGLEHLFLDFEKVNTSHNYPGKLGYCYMYAYRACCTDDNLIYCEGYAMSADLSIPIFHAWCVDKNTHEVIDPAWKDKICKTVYCGLPLNFQFVNQVMVQTGHYGIIEELWCTVKKLENVTMEQVVNENFHYLLFAKD